MPPARKPPIFVLLFFSIFGFVGIAMLCFLWGAQEGFGGPPPIFKIIGSLVALGFVTMGFGAPWSLLRRGKERGDHAGRRLPPQAPSPARLQCPGCGANVGKAEVSPGGDVKCTYCQSWWNIHRG